MGLSKYVEQTHLTAELERYFKGFLKVQLTPEIFFTNHILLIVVNICAKNY